MKSQINLITGDSAHEMKKQLTLDDERIRQMLDIFPQSAAKTGMASHQLSLLRP